MKKCGDNCRGAFYRKGQGWEGRGVQWQEAGRHSELYNAHLGSTCRVEAGITPLPVRVLTDDPQEGKKRTLEKTSRGRVWGARGGFHLTRPRAGTKIADLVWKRPQFLERTAHSSYPEERHHQGSSTREVCTRGQKKTTIRGGCA